MIIRRSRCMLSIFVSRLNGESILLISQISLKITLLRSRNSIDVDVFEFRGHLKSHNVETYCRHESSSCCWFSFLLKLCYYFITSRLSLYDSMCIQRILSLIFCLLSSHEIYAESFCSYDILSTRENDITVLLVFPHTHHVQFPW